MGEQLPRATRVIPAGEWSGEAADAVRLDFDDRHRRRLRLCARGGLAFLLDLADVPTLREGDGLALDDGRIVAVNCADEALLEVHAQDAKALARLAWHLGNRHLPTQLGDGVIHVREDHVIEAMLVQLGARVRHVRAPFHPEGGAYGPGRTHGHRHHDHDHDHDHGHGQGHQHGHAHEHPHRHAHEHERGDGGER